MQSQQLGDLKEKKTCKSKGQHAGSAQKKYYSRNSKTK